MWAKSHPRATSDENDEIAHNRAVRALLGFSLVGLFISGCECGPTSAMSLTVGFDQSQALCVTGGVQLEGTDVRFTTKPAPRNDKSSLQFGVARTATLKGRVIPFARGYRGGDCAAVDLERPDEFVQGDVVDLDVKGVQVVRLTLVGKVAGDGGVDAGVDGGVDAGCGVIDCNDVACDGRTCVGGTCGGTADGGRACLQPGQETLCDDLMDNDGDGQPDCADDDCRGRTCTDLNGCTTPDTCSTDGGARCEPGPARVCPPHTAADCRGSAGACLSATGACDYPLLDAGASCDDGVLCSSNDRCDSAGRCAGNSYSCTATTCAPGAQCDGLGGCSYTIASGAACDDSTSCTYSDRCTDAGVCTGTGYTCTAPVCFSGSACAGDGGCVFSFNGVGSACPFGLCGADGGCVASSAYSYPPSNFDPNQVPDASIAPATAFANCTVEFDTTTNTSRDGGWCGQVRPTPFVFTQDGGVSTTVLAMASFDLATNSTLLFTGSRPVILAVYGQAGIHGVIDGRSLGTTRTGPGGNWSGCGLMNGGDAANSAGGGGAGFGTGGARGGSPGAGDAGVANVNQMLQPLTGGCLGGRGHDSSNRLFALGGFGGGAIQISAAGLMTVDGTISTSGGGGQGGLSGAVDHNGGGGGGSGGAILLEAQQLSLISNARLTCNGGAGGGGREDALAVGLPGEDGALNTAVPALGGQGGTPRAGDGGIGAAGLVAPTAGAAGVGIIGGGGGGAGLGVIRLNGVSSCSIADAGVLLSGVVSRSASCP